MSGKIVKFGDKKIKKHDFYKTRKVTKTDDIDVNKILVSQPEPYGSKIHINALLNTMMMLSDHEDKASANDWIC